jgi:hypothetical protein
MQNVQQRRKWAPLTHAPGRAKKGGPAISPENNNINSPLEHLETHEIDEQQTMNVENN